MTRPNKQDVLAYEKLAEKFGKRKGWAAPRHIGGGILETRYGDLTVHGSLWGAWTLISNGKPMLWDAKMEDAVKLAEKLAVKPKDSWQIEPQVTIAVVGAPTTESGTVKTVASSPIKPKGKKRA